MKFLATIQKIDEPRGGTSATTGNTWARRDVHVEVEETVSNGGTPQTYKHQLIISLSGENAKTPPAAVGDKVELGLSFSINEFNGRFYQNINCYRMVPTD